MTSIAIDLGQNSLTMAIDIINVYAKCSPMRQDGFIKHVGTQFFLLKRLKALSALKMKAIEKS